LNEEFDDALVAAGEVLLTCERHASGKIEDRLERIAVPETEAQAEPRESP
jgi:hypothetical protein